MTPLRSMLGPKGWAAFVAVAAVLAIGVPLMNLAAPPGSALHLPRSEERRVGKECRL